MNNFQVIANFNWSIADDGHARATCDYILANPPYGKDWKKEHRFIEEQTASAVTRRTWKIHVKSMGGYA